MAVTLALVAGCVDAISFDRIFDVFPANQSGNAVLFGIAVGAGDFARAWPPSVAIVGFTVGIVVAVLVGKRVAQLHRPAVLLGLESALLVVVAVVLLATERPGAIGGVESGALLVLASVAMGIQTEVIGRVAGVTVATTYETGAIARIADTAGHRATGDEGVDAAAAPRVPILVSVLVAYIGGAALGSALVAALGHRRGAMVVPVAIVVLLGVAIVVLTARWRRPLV